MLEDHHVQVAPEKYLQRFVFHLKNKLGIAERWCYPQRKR